MASVSSLSSLSSPDEDSFLTSVKQIRVQICEKFLKARKLLKARESVLLADLQRLEDDYTGEGVMEKIKQMNISKESLISTLKANENREMLELSLGPIETRIKELEAKLQTAKDTYKTLAFDWEDEWDMKVNDLGKLLLNPKERGVPDYSSISAPVKVFGKIRKTSEPGVFKQPDGVAIDPITKHLYVCDIAINRVQVFNSSFEFLFLFSEKMEGPAGVCIALDRVYVTQIIGNRVNVYSTVGKFLKTNKSPGLGTPRGIDVSVERKRVYVTDTENNRVQCLDLDLCPNCFIRELHRPICVKLMPEELVVLCRQSPCLILYNYSHEPVREMIACGGDNTVKLPIYIHADNACNLLLTDFESHCVFVFNRKGEMLCKIGKEGENKGEFLHPTGLTIDSDNRILVASRNPNNSIQLF